MSRTYGLGRLYAPDTRDFPMRAGMRALSAVTAPKPRTRPYKLGPTLDQGKTPACTGYALRHLLNAAPVMTDPKVGPSALELYRGAQDNDEWPGHNYEGSSGRGAFKFALSKGYFKSYVFASSTTEARRFIRDGYGTVNVGSNWYAEMFEPGPGGVLPIPPKRSTPVGGHEYFWFWSDDQHDWYQQSWGDKWPGSITLMGQPGCFKMPHALTDRLFREEGEIGAPLQVKVTVKG